MSKIRAGRSATNKGYDRDLGLPGIMGPTGAEWPSTSANVTANRASLLRVVPSRVMKIKSIKFVVLVAAGSDDACDAGIYDSTGTRLVSAGAVTGKLNSTGVKTVEFAETTLEPGKVYFLALSIGAVGTTPAQLVALNNSFGFAGDIFGTGTLANRLMPFVNAAHPLPAGPVAIAGSSSNPWLVGSEI